MRIFFLGGLVCATLGAVPLAQATEAEPFTRPHRFSAQDIAAFADARIVALKAGLQLKAEQETNWPALETALRDAAKARVARIEETRNSGAAAFSADPIGALQRRAHYMAARSGELDKIAAAAKPLYDVLDEAQKRRFGPLLASALHERMRGAPGARRGGDMTSAF